MKTKQITFNGQDCTMHLVGGWFGDSIYILPEFNGFVLCSGNKTAFLEVGPEKDTRSVSYQDMGSGWVYNQTDKQVLVTDLEVTVDDVPTESTSKPFEAYHNDMPNVLTLLDKKGRD